jgi:glycine/D-amino acid oxidase-like deaminating enzyme/nitrite reductase/ring-hydroxylating ferredoxin subunit
MIVPGNGGKEAKRGKNIMLDESKHGQAHLSVWNDAAGGAGGWTRGDGRLVGDTSCDVCIVGGGIAGILTAERLSSLGMSVVVLEAAGLCSGETGRTTAHVSNALDDRYYKLAKLHGARGAALAAASHTAAINRIEELAQTFGIAGECQWRRLDGFLAVNDRHRGDAQNLIQEEFHAAREAGVEIDPVCNPPAPWPHPDRCGPMLRFPNQGQIHPLKFLAGVVRELRGRGVKFYTDTRATKVQGGANASVETEAGPVVRCSHIVVATNTPINDWVTIHTKQMGFQTYVLAFRVPKGTPPILFWDGLWGDDTSYHYVRLYEGGASGGGDGGDLLIVGGEDHKTGQGPEGIGGSEPYRCLEDWTRAMFPMAGAIEARWSGEVMEPADGVAFIGRNPMDKDNVYIVTGDSGNGITHGAVASILIPDLIQGKDNPWATLYDPRRKSGLHAPGQYLRENVNTLAQYTDWLKAGDVQDESEIAPGDGAIVRKGLRHLAIYKDETGRCTRLSATCPHLGGVVRWNAQEKTWDCPCHASRFDRHGHVMHGPANSDLKPVEGEARQPGREDTHRDTRETTTPAKDATGSIRLT